MAYHHGDLRESFLAAAARAIVADGVDAVSLRALAREVGVTHTAPRHHFGDRRGVFTALATQAYLELSAAVAAAPSLLAGGQCYVRYAVTHPGHFAVMFQPGLVDGDDPGLREAQGALSDALAAATGAPPATAGVPLAAWSLAHGLAQLIVSGNVPGADDLDSLDELVRRTLLPLDPGAGPGPGASRT